jgi:hypothetical protein
MVFLKNQTETGSNRPVSVWLGFFGLAWFFQFCSVFFRFGLVFFGLGSVEFFQFQTYKTETEPNRLVFKKF